MKSICDFQRIILRWLAKIRTSQHGAVGGHSDHSRESGDDVLTIHDQMFMSIRWQVVFFLVGWIFFVKMLFRDYELHHNLVQLIFCVNFRCLSWLDPTLTTKKLFSLSCTMFELIIFEIVSFLDKNSRWTASITLWLCYVYWILFRYFHWYFAIYFMLFMVIGELHSFN